MLCDAVPALAHRQCPSLVVQAQQIADKHRKALLLFSECHNIYDKNYIDAHDVDRLCKWQTTFTCMYM